MTQDDAIKALARTIAAQFNTAQGGSLYTQKTIKPGDTLNADSTSEQTFASRCVIPASTLRVGDTITVQGGGIFTSSAVTAPTQRPRVRVGGVIAVDTGPLMLLLGAASARYRFNVLLTVRAIGTAGLIEASGNLFFNNATSGQSVVYTAGPTAGASETGNPIAVNTTQALTVALSTQYSAATAANSNTLRQFAVTLAKAGAASA